MARLSLRHWLKRMAHSCRSGRRQTDRWHRLRTRPHIEAFEDRCVPTTVTNLTDHDPGSLRDAIATTPAGGTVDFQPGLTGTITLTSGQLGISEDLTIAGPGREVITVSGNNASRVFEVFGGTSVTLSGLTVTSGGMTGRFFGGGILVDNGSTLTVSNSTISSNTALLGGGIYNFGTLTISSSTVADNFSPSGSGGGIYNTNLGTLTITNSTISGNHVSGVGAGVENGGGRLTINNTTIGGNFAGLYGGGVVNFISSEGFTNIANSTISGNSAGETGGAIHNEAVPLSITNSTISGNSAGARGGGVEALFGGYVSMRDTILAGNSAPTSPEIIGNLSSQGHNLIGDGTGGSGYAPTDLVGTTMSPIDPMLGPLSDNGGPTQTMALLPGSRAIDAGDNTDAPEWDQRGSGFPRIVNGIIDIGAFEVQQAVAPTVTCSVAQSLLWPPKHQLVNVGLSIIVDPPDVNLHLLVYANDNASAADAAAIGPGTLQLRSERQGNGTGRVYLIVVTATNSGGTSFDVCTVAVPHDHSPRSIASVRQQAADAAAYYQEFQTTPPGYHLLGEGPEGGRAPSSGRSGRNAIPGDIFQLNAPALATLLASPKQGFLWSIGDATVPAEHLLSTGASVPVDGYFAIAREEGIQLITPRLSQANWDESSSPALDLSLMDDRWMV